MPVSINGLAGVESPGYSQGGDPVVESGSNSDGNWTKWSDGTMHVTHQYSGVQVPVATGSMFTTGAANSPFWTFPVPFVSTAHAGACSTNNPVCWGNILLGTTGCEWRGLASTSQGGSAFRLFATGRWK